MKAFTQHTGLVCPLDRANVDTDQIIPKQFLKSIKRTGFGPNLFDEWRYLDVGQPYQDNSTRPVNQDFVEIRHGAARRYWVSSQGTLRNIPASLDLLQRPAHARAHRSTRETR